MLWHTTMIRIQRWSVYAIQSVRREPGKQTLMQKIVNLYFYKLALTEECLFSCFCFLTTTCVPNTSAGYTTFVWLLARILLASDSATSALSSASSNSCWAFLSLATCMFDCSSWKRIVHSETVTSLCPWMRWSRFTHGFLGESLVGFHFDLEFVCQILQSNVVFLVFLRLKETNVFLSHIQ